MTVRSRRRMLVCLVTIALTLPAESILLHAISTPRVDDAAREWVTALSSDQIAAAAGAIESYPFTYRREIMRALAPDQRAAVWQRHIFNYIDANPKLDPSVTALLYNAAAIATADELAKPTDEARAAMTAIAEQTKILLGKDETLDLFYRLGPKDGTFASATPIMQKLANFVRSQLVVEARTADCECSTSFGCGDSKSCSTAESCNHDESWPMCGWLWSEVCDGLCSSGPSGA